MKNLKTYTNTLVIVLISSFSFMLSKYKYSESNSFKTISIAFACIFAFSLAVRKIHWFKPYFVYKFNLLTSKFRYMQEFDFSKEILLEKLVESMVNAGFKIEKVNPNSGDIFATTQISWSSWGENIYVNLKQVGDKTNVNFCSVCFLQLYSWGKNESNYKKLLLEFEKSLII